MVIRVDTYQNLEEDVASALDICVEYLREVIEDTADLLWREHGCGYIEYYREWAEKFIAENRGESITEVYVCHLARSIEVPSMLLPVPLLLTTQNSFSAFLRENMVSFEYDDGKMGLTYRGNKVSFDWVHNQYLDDWNRHLAYRLGYYEDEQDFCVNGFAFRAGIEHEMNGYYRTLQEGPELLQDLDEMLKTDLTSRFKSQSKYYALYIRTAWENVLFDGHEEINTIEDKIDYFLLECMEYLHLYYLGGDGLVEVPVIRFSDAATVLVDHYEEIDE